MKLFLVLVRNGEENYTLAESKESVLEYFSNVHIMDCREIESFIDITPKNHNPEIEN